MRLTPLEPEIPSVGGFTDDNDLFGYRDFAERFANLVCNISEPLVVALDGPWGSGKSVFIKQWAGLLRERGVHTIYFDSFANDYCEDAFLALSAEIHTVAKSALGGNKSVTRRYFNQTKKVGAVLAPLMLRVATRMGTAGILSLSDLEVGNDAVKAAARAVGDEAAKAMDKAISERLRKMAQEKATLAAFREALSEIANNLSRQKNSEHGGVYPLVFIVDELDRCQPPFALSVLERIKHFFTVPGVCFVLVTHLPHLETMTTSAYGTAVDAHAYLEKFYQLRIALPERGDKPAKQLSTYFAHLWKTLGIEFTEPRQGQLVQRDIELLATAHNLSLRRLERVMTNVALVCTAVGPRRLAVAPLIAGLCVMRQTHPDLYKMARRNELTWEKTREFLQPTKERGIQDDWALNWWKYVTAGGALTQDKVDNFGETLVKYNVNGPRDLIPLMAEYIEELAQN
jgi:energy-coupling factor transporter ATP-binding protein EcfA2